MATIIKREGKKGVTYKIQVAIKDVGLGKMVTKSTSWKPEKGMTEKEINTACTLFADEFEKRVIASYTSAEEKNCNVNITFADLSKKWLDRAEMNYGKTYMGNAEESIKVVLPLIGGYRVIVAKPILKEILHERYGYQYYRFFCEPNGLNKCVVRDALRQRTSLETATSISNALGISMGEIFDYEIEETAFQSSYYEGMKKIVRCTLQFAVRLGVLDYNFARKLYITTKHRDANKVHSMTVEEAKLLVQECMKNEDIRKKTAIMFLLFTGVRKGELCGLNWSDFNFERNTVSIKRQYETVAYKGLILKEPKTQSSIRTFELPDGIIALLKEYKVWYDNKKYALADKWESDDDCVFVGKAGKRLHPTTIRNWFDELLDNAGVKHYSVHSLRHTNITLLMIAGVPVVTVSNRVGHSKSMTTLNVYADYLGSSDLEASSKINQYFSEKKEIILKAE